MASKLELRGERVNVAASEACDTLERIFRALGCGEEPARQVAEHLVEASMCGMESHGVMRVLQYAEQYRAGELVADARPEVRESETGCCEVDGGGGIGIPAMLLAVDVAMRNARKTGVAALAIRNVGHIGRLGAFTELAARQGHLAIVMGGGNRRAWRQVAPHGGAKAMLPTNPWSVGVPGGERGPVVMDFATSKIAGGWIYAAKSAGALLPKGCVIDAQGKPTRNPEDYFSGGAILPSGGHKGFAMAMIAEMVAEAMLGPVAAECNWFLICVDATRFNPPEQMAERAEEILEELRACPPAPGFERVEIPGERERDYLAEANGKIEVPEATWNQICELARSLGIGETGST